MTVKMSCYCVTFVMAGRLQCFSLVRGLLVYCTLLGLPASVSISYHEASLSRGGFDLH